MIKEPACMKVHLGAICYCFYMAKINFVRIQLYLGELATESILTTFKSNWDNNVNNTKWYSIENILSSNFLNLFNEKIIKLCNI